MKHFTITLIFLSIICALSAQIIHVPASQPTIQEGINAATDGDTVLVAEGTFIENINFNGKAITVASEFLVDGDTSHISKTIIDGSEPTNPNFGSVVTFDSNEDTTSILCGFTITGGTGTYLASFNTWSGGGIQCYPASAKIIYNRIIDNNIISDGSGYGAGILCDNVNASKIVIENNTIKDNSINSANEAIGAGIAVFGQTQIRYNNVTNNLASSVSDIAAGGISCKGTYYDQAPKGLHLSNNNIINNKAHSQSSNTEGAYSGGLYVEGYYGIIRKNTITDNEVSAHDGQKCYAPGFMSISNPDDIVVENNIIKDNYFTNGVCWGGGICIWMGGGVYQNNVIQNNHATTGGGMFIYSFETDQIPMIINNTITSNNANEDGGGLYVYGSEVVVLNTIIWNNEALGVGDEITAFESTLEVMHSNVGGEEEWPGQVNMNVDPEFQADGCHLHWPSMLVNEGKSSIKINGEWYYAPEYDIDGDERPFDNTYPDIGADEAQWYYVATSENQIVNYEKLKVYPNPVANSATFEFSLESSAPVTLIVYNLKGEIVEVVLDKMILKGKHSLSWNCESLPLGIYYCVFNINNNVIAEKVIKL